MLAEANEFMDGDDEGATRGGLINRSPPAVRPPPPAPPAEPDEPVDVCWLSVGGRSYIGLKLVALMGEGACMLDPKGDDVDPDRGGGGAGGCRPWWCDMDGGYAVDAISNVEDTNARESR